MATAHKRVTPPAFAPIVLTLETKEEYNAVISALEYKQRAYSPGSIPNTLRILNVLRAAFAGA